MACVIGFALRRVPKRLMGLNEMLEPRRGDVIVRVAVWMMTQNQSTIRRAYVDVGRVPRDAQNRIVIRSLSQRPCT